jgi:hypothetical protein
MFARTLLFSLTVAGGFLLVSLAPAQPGRGPGPKGKGGPPGGEVKKLEDELHQLQKQVKEIEDKLARAKEGFGKGKGGFGPKAFDMKKGGPKDFAKAKPAMGEKLDAATIKERYEHYKKLYEALPRTAGASKAGEWKGRGKGFGSFGGMWGKRPDEPAKSSSSIEARLDRLLREVEDLRKEIRKKR